MLYSENRIYDRETNTCFFGETFIIRIKNDLNSLLNFTVFKDDAIKRHQPIGKITVSMDQLLQQKSLTLPVKSDNNEIQIDLDAAFKENIHYQPNSAQKGLSDQKKMQYSVPGPHNIQAPVISQPNFPPTVSSTDIMASTDSKIQQPSIKNLEQQTTEQEAFDFLKEIPKELKNDIMELSNDGQGQLNLLRLTEIYKDFVIRIGPVVQVSNYLRNVYDWKRPGHTVLFSVAISSFIHSPNLCIAIAFLLFYRYSDYIIRSIFDMRNYKSDNNLINNMNETKKNLTYLQVSMTQYNETYDQLSEIVNASDKTPLIEGIILLRNYALFICIGNILLSFQTVLLIAFWFSLLSRTAIGRDILMFLVKESKVYGQIVQAKLSIVLPKDMRKALKVPKQGQNLEKTFHVYENQRWWIGKEWHDTMLPGDRPNWSDKSGTKHITKAYFELPDATWEWVGDWQKEVTQETDSDGWQYTRDFKTFKTVGGSFEFLRRRKWVRTCEKRVNTIVN